MKKNNIILLGIAAAGLSGCEWLSSSLGLTHDQPDEFLVQRNKPLSIPPNYKLIKPLSKQQRQEESQDKAKKLLGYHQGKAGGSSLSESTLLITAANGHQVDKDIRKQVDEDAALTKDIPPKLVKAVESWKKQWKKNCNSKEN